MSGCERKDVSFKINGDVAEVSLNGQPAGRIERFAGTSDDVWTYDANGTSLVGPLNEVQKTIRMNADLP